MKKYKYSLFFEDGPNLVFETNSDLRKAKKQSINGGIFVVVENNYTINFAKVIRLIVEIRY